MQIKICIYASYYLPSMLKNVRPQERAERAQHPTHGVKILFIYLFKHYMQLTAISDRTENIHSDFSLR